MLKKIILLIVVGLMMLTACGSVANSAPISVSGVWARSAKPMSDGNMEMGGSNGGVFMLIKNNTDTADKLVKAESDVAMKVEIHQTVMENDVMMMRPVEFIEVPAKGEVELKPGGYHVMLLGLKQELVVGQKISLTLTFENAGTITVEAEIRAE